MWLTTRTERIHAIIFARHEDNIVVIVTENNDDDLGIHLHSSYIMGFSKTVPA